MARVPGSENRAARARAVGYLRTSSAANVGAEKDSAYRQVRAAPLLAKPVNDNELRRLLPRLLGSP